MQDVYTINVGFNKDCECYTIHKMIFKLTVLCSIRCSLYDNISCQFETTIIIAVYMQIIIYNKGIKVCNQFIQRHKISLQQMRTTQQPAHQLFEKLIDLFVLSAILQASKTEQYGAAKHLLLMGRSLLTGEVLVMVRFRSSHGPFPT